MKKLRILIMMMLALCFAVSASTQNNKDDEGIPDDPNHPVTVAAIREFGRADKELNFVYKELLGVYEKNKDAQAKLVKAQQAWIRYRDLAVSSEIAIYEVGSCDHQTSWNISNMELTKERIVRLRKMLIVAKDIPELEKKALDALANVKKWDEQQKKAGNKPM